MLRLVLDGLPPSANNAYSSFHGKRTLSAKGRKFKKEAAAALVRQTAFASKGYGPNRPYAIFIRIVTPDLYNKTWPNAAESRYKRLDISNRIKLLEDVLSEVLAVDDSNFSLVASEKVLGEKEQTLVWVWDLEREGSPFHAAALSL